jgi:hypothetical protein
VKSIIETTIIYEDDEIRVLWSPGNLPFLVITFGDLITLADGHRFFADDPLKKSSVPAVGVVAKRGNWYPSESIRKAVEKIQSRAATYLTRVVYGGSMGGYAAVKFSALLQATHVIALCPQWSIYPAECEGVNPGWESYVVPEMKGMGIRAQDVEGEVFLFADAFNAQDLFHCRKICENYPGANFISVPLVDHHVTTVLAGTKNLMQIIEACCAGDIDQLKQISHRTSRRHPIKRQRLLRYTMQKLPRLGLRFLATTDDKSLLQQHSDYFYSVISYLATSCSSKKAIAFYERIRPVLKTPTEQQLVCSFLVGVVGGQLSIITTHGSVLIFDLSKSELHHKSLPLEAWELLVQVMLNDTSATFFVVVGGTSFSLVVDNLRPQGFLLVTGRPSEDSIVKIMPRDGGLFTISLNDKHLCAALWTSRVFFDRDDAKDWEMFRFMHQIALS